MNGEFRALSAWEDVWRERWAPIRSRDPLRYGMLDTSLNIFTDALREAMRAGYEVKLPAWGLDLKSGEGA